MRICKDCKPHFSTDAEGPYVELCSVHAVTGNPPDGSIFSAIQRLSSSSTGQSSEDAERRRISELLAARESDLQTIDNLRKCFQENQATIRELRHWMKVQAKCAVCDRPCTRLVRGRKKQYLHIMCEEALKARKGLK